MKKNVEAAVGPVYWIVDKIAHDAKAANSGGLTCEKRIPADWLVTTGVDSFAFYSTFSNFRAHDYDALAGKYRCLTRLTRDAGKKMLLPVHPGHDNANFRDDPYVMPRRDGQTLRDFLRAATDVKADYILVTSWSEWPESTVIEPSSSWPDSVSLPEDSGGMERRCFQGTAFAAMKRPHSAVEPHPQTVVRSRILSDNRAARTQLLCAVSYGEERANP